MPRRDASGGPISAQAQQDLVTEGIENFELPKSVVMKIAKSSLPDNVKLQKETVLSLVKGSTVFINYLAATAHDVALSKQHKSISAADVLKALETIEFADMANKLQGELNIYRDLQKNEPVKGKKSNGSASARRASGTASTVAGAAAGTSVSTTGATGTKGKGKDKALSLPDMGLPPPFTSAPLNRPSAPTAAPNATNAMDVDEDESISRAPKGNEEEDGAVDPDEVVEDEVVDDEEGGSEDEEEELEDTVAAEERELRDDARGVEERGAPMDADD